MTYYKLNTSPSYSNNLFDSWFSDFDLFGKTIGSDTYGDKVKSEGDNYIAKVQIPGVSKNELIIEATEEQLEVKKNDKVIRLISLNGLVDVDKISSDLDLGILTITLPKKSSEKPKKIKIK